MICLAHRFREQDFSDKIDYAKGFIGDIFNCHGEKKKVVGVYVDQSLDIFLILMDGDEISLDSIPKFVD